MLTKKGLLEYQDAIIHGLDSTKKPRLLLHACCAPCSVHVVKLLSEHFKITLFYNGQNIYPLAEYDKRKQEIERLLLILEEEGMSSIEMVAPAVDISGFQQELSFGADEPEGGSRCQYCYGVRLHEAIEYAIENEFDYVTSVMTISRQKCSLKINQQAFEIMKNEDRITYIYSDFKKRKGNELASQYCKEYQIYKQDYCGCVYSLRDKYMRDKKRGLLNE